MANIVVFAGNDCIPGREKHYYDLSYKTGKLLAEAGYTVVSGGGPGLMNELMRGAFEAGGKTIAICLVVSGRKHTEFATEKQVFDNLNKRQEKLISYADGFISLPGGVGTFYEIMAVLAHKRKLEIPKSKPLILLDDYFRELDGSLKKMLAEGFISDQINSFYNLVNTPEEAISLLKENNL